MALLLVLEITKVARGSGKPLGEPEYLDCPRDVEPETLASYVTGTFGPPVDTAFTVVGDDPHVTIGWFVGTSEPEIELLIVPMFRGPDGGLLSLFQELSAQRQEFERLSSEKHLELNEINLEQRPYKPQPKETG